MVATQTWFDETLTVAEVGVRVSLFGKIIVQVRMHRTKTHGLDTSPASPGPWRDATLAELLQVAQHLNGGVRSILDPETMAELKRLRVRALELEQAAARVRSDDAARQTVHLPQ